MGSRTINQSYDDAINVDPLSQSEVNGLYAVWQSKNGANKLPQAHQVPIADQMSAFKYALAHHYMYVEFSIFGPHGTRLKRRMKLSGYTVNREGKNT